MNPDFVQELEDRLVRYCRIDTQGDMVARAYRSRASAREPT